jgi:membrane AbrB-like protein
VQGGGVVKTAVGKSAAPDPVPPPKPAAASWGRRLLTVACAALGGGLAYAVSVPLPWVLGAMGGTAAVMLAGHGARQPMELRRIAQITIGCALGLTFTQDVIAEVASLGGWMVGGAVFSVLLTMLFAPLIQRLARMDGATAVYSVAVGASAEMALQAQRAGANGAQVASAHAIRIILVVSLASVVAHYTGEGAAGNYLTSTTPVLPWHMAALLLVAAPLCGYLANRARVPNAWLLGPLVMTAAIAATGLTARMFPAALIAAQVLIGWSLGQHMTREFFIKSPRVLVSAALVTLCMLTLCVLMAWAVSRGGSFTMLTAFLGVAPGGTAEMAIIAKNFGIGAPIVTAFHFFRVVTMVTLIGWIGRTLLRTKWVKAEAP